MKSDSLQTSGYLWLIAVTLGWGTSWPFLKIALIEIPPWTFRGLIAPSAALFLFGFAILMKESLRVPRAQWRPLVVASLLNITGWHIFSALGLRQMAPGHASIIAYTMPLWAILLGFFSGRRKTNQKAYSGAGARHGWLGGFALRRVWGICPIAFGRALYVALCVFLGRWNDRHEAHAVAHSAGSLVGWQLTLGGLPITLVALVLEVPQLQPVSAQAVWSTVYVLVIPIVFCWIAWFKVIQQTSITVATVSMLMIPVVGVISANLILSEPIGWREIGALALVCLALAMVLSPQIAPGDVEPSEEGTV